MRTPQSGPAATQLRSRTLTSSRTPGVPRCSAMLDRSCRAQRAQIALAKAELAVDLRVVLAEQRGAALAPPRRAGPGGRRAGGGGLCAERGRVELRGGGGGPRR